MKSLSSTQIEDEAVGWFVALNAGDAPESEFLRFRDWLEASDAHRAAFDRVEAAWIEADGLAPSPAVQPVLVRPHMTRRPKIAIWAGGAIAAAAAVVFAAPMVFAPSAVIYETAKGERSEIALADGSRVTLNSGSRISVRLGRRDRRVELQSGEAVFDVAHDAARPFEVAAGDARIRDIGTAFDVDRSPKGLTVTVLHGVVALTARQVSELRLVQGDQVVVAEGGAKRTRLDNPELETSWREGRLIYRDQTLAEIATDLNRYLPTPVEVDPAVGELRFSGVLQIDREDVMLSRLEQLMPVKAVRGSSAVRLVRSN